MMQNINHTGLQKTFQEFGYTMEHCKDNNQEVEKIWHNNGIAKNRMSR